MKKKDSETLGGHIQKDNPSDVPPNFLKPCWILWELQNQHNRKH